MAAGGSEVILRLPLQAQLCEGLHWCANDAALWGVDIHGCRVWRWDTESRGCDQWDMGQRVGWVIPEAGGQRLLLGLQSGFALASRQHPARVLWTHDPFGARPAMRLNDAKADGSGAVWAGSLNNDDESRPEGCLFRLDTSGRCMVADEGYAVANGPAISPDGTRMLHTDSVRRTIYAFDVDANAGALCSKQIWKTFSEADGYPDGMCYDAEGAVWVAHWGAGCISRFAADGSLLRRIHVPASQVTNVCFAGPKLDRLFVSTASVGLSQEALAGQPHAGGLFEVLKPGVRGLPGLPAGPFHL